LLFNGAEESDGSMQWFHFFDGIFLGQWYPEGFHAKIMVLKRFTRSIATHSHCRMRNGPY